MGSGGEDAIAMRRFLTELLRHTSRRPCDSADSAVQGNYLLPYAELSPCDATMNDQFRQRRRVVSLDYTECAWGTIQEIQHITIATIHKDTNGRQASRPWNSPVYSAFDSDCNFYWISDRYSQHSKNIQENPHVFLTIYDSTVPQGAGIGRGVYIQAEARELSDPSEVAHAQQLLASRVGKTPRTPGYFLDDMPRRIYQAVPERAWVNSSGERNGHFIDIRVEIDLASLRG